MTAVAYGARPAESEDALHCQAAPAVPVYRSQDEFVIEVTRTSARSVVRCRDTEDARRIAAALNYVEGVTTLELEECVRQGYPLQKFAASASAAAAALRLAAKHGGAS